MSETKIITIEIPNCFAIPRVRRDVKFTYFDQIGWVGEKATFDCDKGKRRVVLYPSMDDQKTTTTGCKGCIFFNDSES